MKKQTISALLTALMICLTIAIIVVIIRIQMRGPAAVEPVDSESYIVQEDTGSQNVVPEEEPEEVSMAVTELVAVPNTSTSVNVRSGPGTEYNRLGSAYSNNEYVVLEILSVGWTKILYSEQEAYIHNDYVDYKVRITDGDNVSYETANEDVLAGYMSEEVPVSGVSEDPVEGTEAEPQGEEEPTE